MNAEAAERRMRKFAGRLAAALKLDAWGDVDPDLFREIAEETQGRWSPDARSLARCLREALK